MSTTKKKIIADATKKLSRLTSIAKTLIGIEQKLDSTDVGRKI